MLTSVLYGLLDIRWFQIRSFFPFDFWKEAASCCAGGTKVRMSLTAPGCAEQLWVSSSSCSATHGCQLCSVALWWSCRDVLWDFPLCAASPLSAKAVTQHSVVMQYLQRLVLSRYIRTLFCQWFIVALWKCFSYISVPAYSYGRVLSWVLFIISAVCVMINNL